MPVPTLKQMEAFYWAATSANFAVAARRLHLSTSSLSKRISELEQAVGRSVFDRGGHRAVLTEDGHALLPAVVRVLDSVAALQGTFAKGRGLTGRVRFGVGELSALTWLPRFIAVASRAHTQLRLEPYVDVGAVLEDGVEAGELDFAVVANRSSSPEVVSQWVADARFVWVAHRDLAGEERRLTPDLLARRTLVTLPAGAGTTRILDEWLLAHGLDDFRRIACNNWMAVAGMLRESVGIGLLPEGWTRGREERELVRLDSDPPLSTLRYAFQWRRGDTRGMIPAMLELVRQKIDFSTMSA